MPPKVEPNVQIRAKNNAFSGEARDSAINSKSGGMGKKEDSMNARMNSPYAPSGSNVVWVQVNSLLNMLMWKKLSN